MDLERAEIEGYADTFRAAPGHLAREHAISHAEIEGATCLAVGALAGSRLFNHVLGLGRRSPARDEVLDRIAARYGAERYYVALSPEAAPADLPDRLAARGFEHDYAWMKFRRGADPPEPVESELRVVPIGRERAGDFGRIVAAGFELPHFVAAWVAGIVGRPGWSCFLALDGEAAAATGALYVDGPVGWLSYGATLPEHRRRGAQSVLLAARIGAAAALGCATLVTETGEAAEGRPSGSYRNILRAGFEEVYLRPNLRSP
jgi:GNAT superfamily N-acetyltransferase